MAGKAGNRGKTDKVGAHRVAFDQAAALEALKWATGGQQLDIPGIGARRFVGVEALPDDGQPRGLGGRRARRTSCQRRFASTWRPSTARPSRAWRSSQARPVVSIVAELVEAFRTIATALGISRIPS
jgi:hypothetical protein